MYYRIFQTLKAVYYSLIWSWNPTNTNAAIKSLQAFLNQKKSFPILKEATEINGNFLSNPDFVQDMESEYDFVKMKNKYAKGSLGYEYAVFMETLDFKPLQMQLDSHIPKEIQNYLKMGVKNHDMIHFLFELYDKKEKRLEIRDFHEWIFLYWSFLSVDFL